MKVSSNEKSLNIIDNKTSFQGILNSKSDISVNGNIEGIISTSGTVNIGKKGYFNGNILCNNAKIEGCFNGELIVSNSLNIKKGSIIEGNVKFHKLIIDSGAIFNTKCANHSYNEGVEIFKRNSDQQIIQSKYDSFHKNKIQNKSLKKGIYYGVLYFNDIRKLLDQINETKTLIKERTIWKKKYYYQLKGNNKNYQGATNSKFWQKINNLIEENLIEKIPNKRKPLYLGDLVKIEDKVIKQEEFENESIVIDYIKKCENKRDIINNDEIKYDFSFNDFITFQNININNSIYSDVSEFDKKTNLILPKNQRINNKIILKSFDLDFETFDDIIEFKYSESNIKELKRIYIFHEY